MNLAELTSWSKRTTATGVLLVPPGGTDAGMVRIDQQVRPIVRFRQVLADLMAAGHPGYTADVGPVTVMHTVEGEHAGMVTLALRSPSGARVERIVAMIVGDDHYALIDAVAADAARAPMFRDLVDTLTRFYFLGLGEPRRRRVEYAPPPGWHPVPRPYAVRWIHPQFPARSGAIVVHHARPLAATTPDAEDRLLFVDENVFVERDPPQRPAPLRLPSGLEGSVQRVSGKAAQGVPFSVARASLTDARYLYLADLHTRAADFDDNAAAFVDLIKTLQPIPVSRARGSAHALVHWTE